MATLLLRLEAALRRGDVSGYWRAAEELLGRGFSVIPAPPSGGRAVVYVVDSRDAERCSAFFGYGSREFYSCLVLQGAYTIELSEEEWRRIFRPGPQPSP